MKTVGGIDPKAARPRGRLPPNPSHIPLGPLRLISFLFLCFKGLDGHATTPSFLINYTPPLDAQHAMMLGESQSSRPHTYNTRIFQHAVRSGPDLLAVLPTSPRDQYDEMYECYERVKPNDLLLGHMYG
jgi:hypothetical protein